MSCVLLLGKENVFEGGGNASFVTFISIANCGSHRCYLWAAGSAELL